MLLFWLMNLAYFFIAILACAIHSVLLTVRTYGGIQVQAEARG